MTTYVTTLLRSRIILAGLVGIASTTQDETVAMWRLMKRGIWPRGSWVALAQTGMSARQLLRAAKRLGPA